MSSWIDVNGFLCSSDHKVDNVWMNDFCLKDVEHPDIWYMLVQYVWFEVSDFQRYNSNWKTKFEQRWKKIVETTYMNPNHIIYCKDTMGSWIYQVKEIA